MFVNRFFERFTLSPDPGEPGGATEPDQTKQDDQAGKGGGGDPQPKPDKTDAGTGGEDPRITQAREEAISERKKRQELETKIKDLEGKQDALLKGIRKAAGLDPEGDDDPATALETARTERDQAIEKSKTALIRAAAIAEAAKQGAVDPETVARLIDLEGIEVDLDQAKVTGVDKAVTALLKAKEYLKGKQATPPAGGTPPDSDPDPVALEKDELIKLAKEAREGKPGAVREVIKRLPEFHKAGIDVSSLR